MRAFGESLVVYRPPIDTRAAQPLMGKSQMVSLKRRLTS